MLKKLTKAQGKRLLKVMDAADECFHALRLLKKKKFTSKDKAKFTSCMSKILSLKSKK